MNHERNKPRKRVSVWNWMGTLIMLSIHGVNIVVLSCLRFWRSPSQAQFRSRR